MKKATSLLAILCLVFSITNAQPCTIPDDLFPEDTIVVCQGSSYILNAPVVAGASYAWSTEAANTSFTNISNDGRYWLTISDANCTRSDTVTILFNSFLLAPVFSDKKLCKGQPATPLVVEGQNILWYTDAIGGTGTPGVPALSTADTSVTTYWFTQTLKGCESPRVPLVVRVIDKPFFELGEAFIIPCGAAGITLQIVPDGESEYTWSDGSHGVSMTVVGRGRYSLYAQNMCGEYRDTVQAVECQDYCVQFPTAFSPNGDGKNDLYLAGVFCPVPKFRLTIYNRNGETVFQTSDPSAGWNGYFKGKEQPIGAYVFYAEFYDFVLKNTFVRKGSFVLVR